jgi:hypothetical protein
MINVEKNIFGKKRVKTFFDRQDEIQKHIGIPILNIIDAAADQIKAMGLFFLPFGHFVFTFKGKLPEIAAVIIDGI